MNENSRSLNYAAKRIQAIQSMERRIQQIVFPKAKAIIAAARKYRSGDRLSNESALLKEARSITATAQKDIEAYTSAYAKASCDILGIESENIESFLSGDIYGKTLSERNAVYLANFAEDIVRMIKAGTVMGYSESQILSSIRTGYKDPYHTSVVTKAQRKEINIATPSYGKGIFRNAYENIVRNASQVISIAWGKAEQEYGKENGAVGYYVHRGSSYNCPVCDDLCGYLHSLKTMVVPAHVNCVCRVELVFKKDNH